MLQRLLCLAVTITVVYSARDCCTESDSTYEVTQKCNNTMDKECHLKNYGVYCCNENVTIAIGAFADDAEYTVRSNYQ